MAENTKTKKISDIAKDFSIDSKTAIAIFKELGIEKGNSGAAVTDEEAELFINKYSFDNQLENFEEYLDKKAILKTDRPKSAADKKPRTEKKQERQDAPAVTEKKTQERPKEDILSRVTVSTPAKKPQPQVDKHTQGRNDQKPSQVVKTPAPNRQNSAQGQPQRRDDRSPQKRGGAIDMKDIERRMAEFRENQQRLEEEAKRNRLAQAQTAERRREEQKNKAAEAQRTDAPRAAEPTADQLAKAQQKAEAQQKAAQKAMAATQKRESADRWSQRPVVGGEKQKQQKKDENRDKRSNKIVLPMNGSPAPQGSGEVVVATQKTRIVDTRTTVVDLSKYDEKLDTYASGVNDQKVGKQKLKKQDNRQQGKSAKEKDRLAKEKIKRLEAEMARKKQLEITVPDEIVVSELAVRLKKTSAEVIKQLFKLGMMATVNETIDFDTAYLVAEELGAKVTKEVVVTIEEKLFDEAEDSEESLIQRSPVVCVMGHVDHGKTSLLDAIRHTNVTSGEAGGITQAIGAYRVMINDSYITFLDTPGHEAFTAMRARGAQATDIAILVVAADDGIMPQTVEAINHAKAAGVEVIVAINKMDKPHANADQVMQELTKYDLLPEAWGGETICVPVSALTGMGIDSLLESVLLVAEMKDLKANPNRRAKGLVIEARLDKGRGPVATVLVQKGTLHHGDIVIAGTAVGRVRAMIDDNGRPVTTAGPSIPVEIDGLAEVPLAGDEFNAVEDEKMARSLAEQRRDKAKQESLNANAKVSLDDLFSRISDGVKSLNIIVKADVIGSAEAVKASLVKLTNEEVKVNVIHTGVGGITENDVMLASASNAIIVGFSVRPDKNALDSAERQGVDIRTYRIIYECIEEITAAMKGMLAPQYKEVLNGHAEVRQTIHVPSVGTIAGSYVQDGKITRKSLIRVVRDGVVIAEDKISSLKRFKDDVREVAQGYECGIGLDKFNDIKLGDVLEAYEMQEIER